MVLHQAGEVLHCDETGVLWVQLEKQQPTLRPLGQKNGIADNSCIEDAVSVMHPDFVISSTAEMKCQVAPRENAAVIDSSDVHTHTQTQ